MSCQRKFLSGFLALFLMITCQTGLYASADEFPSYSSEEEAIGFKKVILSLDGGGARGVFQALFLKELEARARDITNAPELKIGECLDFIAGTSTGSISGGVLAYPDPENPQKPKYDAHFLVDYYDKNIDKVFQRSWFKKIASAMGLLDEQYSDKGLNTLLDELFGETPLTEACVPFIASAFELSDQGEGSRPYIFSSCHVTKDHKIASNMDKNSDFSNVKFHEAIRSSGAAPTYFERKMIRGQSGKEYYFVDGGMTGANNPAALAYAHGKKVFDQTDASGCVKKKDIFCLSLGTGKSRLYINGDKSKNWGGIGWLPYLLPTLMNGPSMLAEDAMEHTIFDPEKYSGQYYRLQPVLEKNIDLADTSEKAIQTMKTVASTFIKENDKSFDRISQILAARYQVKKGEINAQDLLKEEELF